MVRFKKTKTKCIEVKGPLFALRLHPSCIFTFFYNIIVKMMVFLFSFFLLDEIRCWRPSVVPFNWGFRCGLTSCQASPPSVDPSPLTKGGPRTWQSLLGPTPVSSPTSQDTLPAP